MKYGIAKAEKNGNPSITMNVRTRTPLEAFQMLRQGQPIDVMAAYYEEQDQLTPDFWMLDKTAKLHALAYLKADNAQRELDIKSQIAEIEANHKQQQDDIKAAEQAAGQKAAGQNNQVAQGNNQGATTAGAVS